MRRAVLFGLLALGAAAAHAAARRAGEFSPADVLDEAVSTVTGAVGAWTLPAAGEPYRTALEAATATYALPENMLGRQAWQESRFRPDARSPAGALGIMQFMPATAAELGVNPLDPFASIDAAGRYMRQLHDRFEDWRLALAAYNFGQGRVARGDSWPKETRDYVEGIAGDVGLA